MSGFRFRSLLAFGAVLMALVLVSADAADARPKFSVGSRGTRTYTAPPSTATAPTTARPVERSMTQPGAATAAARPNAAAPGGFFNRPGLLGGLAAGFLGAGLLGMLFGNGLFGGLGGFASILGLILQVGLIVIVARLLWAWWQRRQQPAMAAGPNLRDAGPDPQANMRTNLGGLGGSFGGLGATAQPAANPAGHDEVGLTASDFDVYEQLLGEVLKAYSAEDLAGLRARTTPEMVSYYAEEMAALSSRGLVNEISDVKLLKGDLAEAWREPGADYATVAMHYALKDRTIERATGKVVEGGDELQEATEVWTFRRSPGGQWLVSAVQQA